MLFIYIGDREHITHFLRLNPRDIHNKYYDKKVNRLAFLSVQISVWYRKSIKCVRQKNLLFRLGGTRYNSKIQIDIRLQRLLSLFPSWSWIVHGRR